MDKARDEASNGHLTVLLIALLLALLVACAPTAPVVSTSVPPTEAPLDAPIPTSTIVTPLSAYATQDAARQTAIAARATASRFPTAVPSTVQTGEPFLATVRRDGLSLEARLAKDTCAAGEAGRVEVVLYNDGPEKLFVNCSGGQAAWLTLRDEQGQAPAPWPWTPLSFPGWNRCFYKELAPGQMLTETLTLQLPPDLGDSGQSYDLWVETQFSRPAPDTPQGPDNLWLSLAAGPIPLQAIRPEPGQRLVADLQADREGWHLRVTDADGQSPPGPLWGFQEITSFNSASAGPLHDSSNGEWSAAWHENEWSDKSEICLRIWVAAPGYVTAVVTETVPGTGEAHCMSWVPEPPLRQTFLSPEAAQAALAYPLYQPGFLPAGAQLEEVRVETMPYELQGWGETVQAYHLADSGRLELSQQATAEPYATFGWGAARYDPEAKVVAVGQTTGYAIRRFGWWLLDWKCGDAGLELRAPVEALNLEELVAIAAGVRSPDGTCPPAPIPTTPTQVPPPTPTTAPSQIRWTRQVTVVAELTAASAGPPAWSPDGSALAFHTAEGLAVAHAPDFAPQTIFGGPTLGAMWDWPGFLWQLDGARLVFRTSTERNADGQLMSVGTLGSVTPDGSDLRDLLPGWKATLSGPSYAVGLAGWLDNGTLAFHVHCGTECEYLYALDLATGDLLDLHIFGPRFFVQPSNPWIVAQHGPSGRVDFTLVHRDSATIAGPQTAAPAWPSSAVITRTLPLFEHSGAAFADWAPASPETGTGRQRLLAVAWDQGWMPLEETTSNLYLWDVQANTATLLAPDVLDAAWSPGGRYIALLVPGKPVVEGGIYLGTHPKTEGARAYSLVVLDVEEERVCFSVEGPSVPLDVWEFFHGRLRPRWSPQGTLLLFFDAAGDLAYYQPATGRSAALTKGSGSLLLDADSVNLTFSPNGQLMALIVDEEDGRPARIYVVDVGELAAGD